MTDVIIIGAGAAGLAAWRALHSAGLAVAVVEARDRLGGRIWTDRIPDSDFPVELGAEFIHGDPASTSNIVAQAGLKTIEAADAHLLGGPEGLAPFPEFWSVVEKVNEQINPKRECSYEQFLAGAAVAAFDRRVARSYVEGFNAARADRISAAAVWAGEQARQEPDGGRQCRLPAGYDSVIRWLAAGLPAEALHLRTVVREVRWQKRCVELLVSTGAGPKTFRSSRLLITVPIGVLRAPPEEPGGILFEPPLPSEKREALLRIESGHAFKLMVRCRERFWEKNGPFGFATALDGSIPTWWTQEPVLSNILTGWAGGPAAEHLIGLSTRQLRALAVATLAEVFNLPEPRIAALVEGIYFHNWSSDPFSRGAYSYPGVGGMQAAQTLAKPVQDTLFFAGEGTDAEGANGTVSAALESGERAANEIRHSQERLTPAAR